MIVQDYVEFVNWHCNRNGITQFKNIRIFTDSNVLNINGYPEFNTHYRLLQKIFSLLSILNTFNINIEIIKIPSHSGIEENHIVDYIANRAALISKDCKYGKSTFMKYNTYYNPVHVDISIDLKRLRYQHRKERRKEWKKKYLEWTLGLLKENYYKGNMIFYKMMFSHNIMEI